MRVPAGSTKQAVNGAWVHILRQDTDRQERPSQVRSARPRDLSVDDRTRVAQRIIQAAIRDPEPAHEETARRMIAEKRAAWLSSAYTGPPSPAALDRAISDIRQRWPEVDECRSVSGLSYGESWPSLSAPGVWELVLGRDGKPAGHARIKLANGDEKSIGPKRLHHAGDVEADAVLAITEGYRKANEWHRITGQPAVGLGGVSPGAAVLDELRELIEDRPGATLLIALDAGDILDPAKDHTRGQMAGTLARVLKAAQLAGASVLGVLWDAALGNGPDDALAAVGDVCRVRGVPQPLGLPPDFEVLSLDDYLGRWAWTDERLRERAELRVRQVVARGLRRNAAHNVDAKRDELKRHVLNFLHAGDGSSVSLSCPPGLGKTTATRRCLLDDLAARRAVHVLAEPTVGIAIEKADQARMDLRGADIQVELLLGVQEAGERFVCVEGELRHRNIASGRASCSGCPRDTAAQCQAEPGRFLHDDRVVRDRVDRALRSEGTSVLLVTTHAKVLADARQGKLDIGGGKLVLDDVSDSMLGLVDEDQIAASELEAVVKSAAAWWRSADWALVDAEYRDQLALAHPRMPTAMVAKVVEAIGAALLDTSASAGDPDVERLGEAVRSIRSDVVAGILSGHATAPRGGGQADEGWPFESAEQAGAVRFGLDVVRRVAERVQVACAREGHRVVVRALSTPMVELVRSGRVLWLGVAPILPIVAESLGVRSIELDAENQHAYTVGVVGQRMGTGVGPDRERNSELRRALRDATAERAASGLEIDGVRFGSKVGAVLHKRDRHAGDAETTVHQGNGSSATDRLESCDILFVPDWREPDSVFFRAARDWSNFLGLDPVDPPVRVLRLGKEGHPAREVWEYSCGQESAPWAGVPEASSTRVRVPADPIARQVFDFRRKQSLLNAAGRHRPLNATAERPRLLVTTCPIPGVKFNAVWRFSEYVAGLKLDTAKHRVLSENREVATRGRQMEEEELVAKILVDRPHASRYELAASTGLSEWAVRTAMERLGYRDGGNSSIYYSRQPSSSVTSDAESVGSLTPEASRQIAEALQLSVKSVEKRRRVAKSVLDRGDDGVPIDPRTARALEETAVAASLLALPGVTEAVSRHLPDTAQEVSAGPYGNENVRERRGHFRGHVNLLEHPDEVVWAFSWLPKPILRIVHCVALYDAARWRQAQSSE